MDVDLRNKRAIVPASSRGLGRAVATELARNGAEVLISSRSEENLAEASDHVVESAGVDPDRVHAVAADLTEEADVARLVETGLDRLGGLDVLVTNHGGVAHGELSDVDLDVLDGAYRAALRSTFQLVQACLPALADGGGSMTHVVAVTARESPGNLLLSNVVRPGIYGLSKTVSNVYGAEGVRSNCVEPLLIRTDRVDGNLREQAEERGVPLEEVEADFLADIPLDRFGSPEEFARAVAFLASDDAGFVSGAVLPVDGGWSNQTF